MRSPTIKYNLDFQLLFESAPGLFLILKPDAPHFTILGASDAYLNATMTKRDKIKGLGLFEVFPDNPDDLTATGTNNLRRSLEKVLKEKSTHKMEIQKYDIPRPASKGGGFEERYWSPANSPVFNEKKEVIYIIHQAEDISELILSQKKSSEQNKRALTEIQEQSSFIKKNEERINEIMDVLLKYTLLDFSQKAVVSDAGDELDAIAVGLNTLSEELESHIAQVEDTNKQLGLVNKELESFSYSVSHDLRAPLRAVNGYAQMLNEDYGNTLDEEGKRILSNIGYNATKMGQLIDELLAFSRLGRKEVQKTKIDLNELTEGVLIDMQKSVSHQAEIKIKKLHSVFADYSLLHQVVFNLVSNAVKYSSKKKESVVEIFSEEKNDEIIFTVKDNGAGFNMEYAGKLFGVFQRLHSQEEFEGTGVGLAIIQRIVTKHGGKVWAEGKVNEGAIFNFSLPKT